jgi:hypothetical protein
LEYALYKFLSRMMPEHIPVRRHRLSGLDICDVTLEELEIIQSSGSDLGLDFQIAQFCLTVAISFLASVLSSPPGNERVYTVFVVMIVVGFALGVIFAIKWWRCRGAFSKNIQKIRDRRVGPVGTTEHEIAPTDLENLTSVEPPPAAQAGNTGDAR